MKIQPPDNVPETTSASENHIRQPETEQSVSAETAHLSDAEAALYRKLRQHAKRCARIGMIFWIIMLAVPVGLGDGLWYPSAQVILLILFKADIESALFLLPQVCLVFLGIRRMGQPRKTSMAGDCLIWVYTCIGLALLFMIASPAMWFWLVSAVFVTRAGSLHMDAIRLLNNHSAPNNAVQVAAENSGTETVAEAVHSDSPTHDNPSENRL